MPEIFSKMHHMVAWEATLFGPASLAAGRSSG